MKASRLHRRWRNRFCEYSTEIRKRIPECRQTGGAESIHRLRVALRRCRLLAGLASFIIGKEPLDQFRRETGQLLDALGRVRDLDVTLNWLRDHEADEKAAKPIERKRERLWQEVWPLLARAKPGAVERLRDARADADEQRRLKKRYARQIDRLGDLRGFLAHFRDLSTEESHELRRAVRRWRYLRELVLSRSEQQNDQLLQALLRFQEALGGAQDRVVIETALTNLHRPRLVQPLLAAIGEERQRLVFQARRLFAKMVKLQQRSARRATPK